MSLRRRTPLVASRGTLIPIDIRRKVLSRDKGCVGPRVGMLGDCVGAAELDHVRASGAMGKKSPTVATNLVSLCAFHHWYKTTHGREVRPVLVAYIDDAMERTEAIG